MLVVLKGKKKSLSGFHQAWQSRKGLGVGGNAGVLTSPTTGKEARWIAGGEEAVKSNSVFNQAALQTLVSSICQSVFNLPD